LNRKKINILIIGASGFIGSNLFKYFEKKKYEIQGTYFKNKKKNYIFFDVRKNRINSLKFKKKLKYIVIAHSINVNLDDTKKNFKKSYFINVTKTKSIIDYCFNNNIVPVYISSDGVFDGNKGNYKETDRKNPLHSYGKIKNEVEEYILRKKKKYLIIRVSRVFGVNKNDKTILTNYKQKMQTKRKIICSYDQIFSPIFIDDLSNYLEKLIRNKYFGIFHLSSIKMITHFEIAKSIKKFFKIKKIKILARKINSLKLIETRPLLTNLSTYKFDSIFNIKYNNLNYYLKKIQ